MAEGHHSSMWLEVTSIEESPDQCILAPWRTYHIWLLLLRLKLNLACGPHVVICKGAMCDTPPPFKPDLSQTWHTCTHDLPQSWRQTVCFNLAPVT